MSDKNIIFLEGRLGVDAEVKATDSGLMVCTLNIANKRSWKKGDDWQEETFWVRVNCFGTLATRAGQLKKGEAVIVEGRLEIKKYKETFYTSIAANDVKRVEFLRNADGAQVKQDKLEPQESEDDGLPF
jgi:single stranded DNA-binding protein